MRCINQVKLVTKNLDKIDQIERDIFNMMIQRRMNPPVISNLGCAFMAFSSPSIANSVGKSNLIKNFSKDFSI